MNHKVGLFITHVIYLFVIISLLVLALYPKRGIAEAVTVVTPKTLGTEIDRLSSEYQVDRGIIRAIIACESSFYGHAVNHNKLKDGTIWSTDFGPFQINDYFHEAEMKKLGLDIHNQWDSLEYGFMLFKSQGSKPWSASKACWSKLI